MSNQKTLKITKIKNQWHVTTLIDNKPSAELIELFGTATLPCAYTPQADADYVVAEITKRNPDAIVILELSGVDALNRIYGVK